MDVDTLLSVRVWVSWIIITDTNWFYIDPIISIINAIIILISTWRLLSESLRLSIDGVPKNINKDNVVSVILENSNVIDVHHLHIWAISTTENALTAHIIISDIEQMIDTKHCLKQRLNDLGISHDNLEYELKKENCED